ncbi:MAG: 6-carboxytetrahydropterin synthase [Bradyrhizobiaceae bacterium]|nr:6-carboxytetrahydropterin synthase [Bradyrhizobiaceae bacterium]
MVYVTRTATFSAAHRLFNPSFSNDQNEQTFDKCNNPFGHGHNYVVEVTVKGQPDPATGYVIDLKQLKTILDERVIDLVDHKHLNHDVDFLDGLNPTVENLCIAFWQQLADHLPSGELHSIKVWESDANTALYTGEPVTLHYWDRTGLVRTVEVGHTGARV